MNRYPTHVLPKHLRYLQYENDHSLVDVHIVVAQRITSLIPCEPVYSTSHITKMYEERYGPLPPQENVENICRLLARDGFCYLEGSKGSMYPYCTIQGPVIEDRLRKAEEKYRIALERQYSLIGSYIDECEHVVYNEQRLADGLIHEVIERIDITSSSFGTFRDPVLQKMRDQMFQCLATSRALSANPRKENVNSKPTEPAKDKKRSSDEKRPALQSLDTNRTAPSDATVKSKCDKQHSKPSDPGSKKHVETSKPVEGTNAVETRKSADSPKQKAKQGAPQKSDVDKQQVNKEPGKGNSTAVTQKGDVPSDRKADEHVAPDMPKKDKQAVNDGPAEDAEDKVGALFASLPSKREDGEVGDLACALNRMSILSTTSEDMTENEILAEIDRLTLEIENVESGEKNPEEIESDLLTFERYSTMVEAGDIRPYKPKQDAKHKSAQEKYEDGWRFRVSTRRWVRPDQVKAELERVKGELSKSEKLRSLESTRASLLIQQEATRAQRQIQNIQEQLDSLNEAREKEDLKQIKQALVLFDTNVYIDRYMYIDEFVEDVLDKRIRASVLLPSEVLRELDGLKRNPDQLGKDARQAVRAIASLLRLTRENRDCRVPLVVGQASDEVYRDNGYNRNPYSLRGDDRILNCALYFARERNARVIVCSDDVNMRNFAMCNNLESCRGSEWMRLRKTFI